MDLRQAFAGEPRSFISATGGVWALCLKEPTRPLGLGDSLAFTPSFLSLLPSLSFSAALLSVLSVEVWVAGLSFVILRGV